MDFKGKTVVVTGGSAGIGKAIVIEMGKRGANVVFTFNSNEEKALRLVEEIKSYGADAITVKSDVTRKSDVSALADAAYEKFKRVDFLVNNAGITADNLLIRMKEDEFDRVIDTNLKGVFLCTQEFGKRMLKAKSGRIINISSIVGVMGNPGQANYAASKAGVIGFTKSVAKEFASRGILVNAIAPGFIETDMTAKLSEEVIAEYKKAIPLGKLGSPEDITNTVMFLCSDMSAYITGQIIQVDGGMYM